MQSIVHVSNKTQLLDAIASAKGPTQFILDGGNYGSLKFQDKSELTFTSSNPADPATFNSLNIRYSSGISFDQLQLKYHSGFGDAPATRTFRVENSDDVNFSNCIFRGDDASGVGSGANGTGAGVAIFFRNVQDISLTDNDFKGYYRGPDFINCKDINVLSNKIYDMSSDGIVFAACKNATVDGNYIHDFRANDNTSAHMDMIQVFSRGTNTPSENIKITNNILDSHKGHWTQSIFIGNEAITRDGAGAEMRYKNFLIEGNIIRNSHKHGIAVNNIDGIVIKNNTIVQNAADAEDSSNLWIPKVNINGGVKGAIVENNVLEGINGSSWTGQNNVFVQRKNPSQSDHYDNAFLDGLADASGGWQSLLTKPGGIIDGKGVGAYMLSSTEVGTPIGDDPSAPYPGDDVEGSDPNEQPTNTDADENDESENTSSEFDGELPVDDSVNFITQGKIGRDGIERFTWNDAEDLVLIDAKFSLEDLRILIDNDRIQIFVDDDRRLDYAIKLHGDFSNGQFYTKQVGDKTVVGFTSEESTIGVLEGDLGDSTTGVAGVNLLTESWVSRDGSERFKFKKGDGVAIDASPDDIELRYYLSRERVKIDVDGDWDIEAILHIEGESFSRSGFYVEEFGEGSVIYYSDDNLI